MTATPIVVLIALTLPDNLPAKTVIAPVSVLTSDGSKFAGVFGVNPPGNSVFMINGGNMVLTRALTSADDGMHQWSVSATENGVTVWANIEVNIVPATSG
jgi:hypothetical protein